MTGRSGRYPSTLTEAAGPTSSLRTFFDHTLDAARLAELDADWSITCEYLVDGRACGADAAWWTICRACHHPLAFCDPHRRIERLRFDSWAGHVCCVNCFTVVRARDWRSLFRIEPIEGTSP